MITATSNAFFLASNPVCSFLLSALKEMTDLARLPASQVKNSFEFDKLRREQTVIAAFVKR